jgi:hypothetical protein
MANRSYLYSVDSILAGKKKVKPIRSLSEWNYAVPLSHQLLVSGSPKRCTSAIWDHEIGIAGEYGPGRDRLLRLLAALEETRGLKKKDEFVEAATETRKVLQSKKRAGRYFLLEAGEIFDLGDEELVPACDALVKEVSRVAREVDEALSGHTPKLLSRLAKRWEDELGLYWADVLYFDFGV